MVRTYLPSKDYHQAEIVKRNIAQLSLPLRATATAARTADSWQVNHAVTIHNIVVSRANTVGAVAAAPRDSSEYQRHTGGANHSLAAAINFD